MRLAEEKVKNNGKSSIDKKSDFRIRHESDKSNGMIFLILTVIWGMMSSSMCFMTSFRLTTDAYKIILMIVITAVISWFCASLKNVGNILTAVLFMIYIMAGAFLIMHRKEQFMVLNNEIAGIINKVYYTSFFEFDISKQTAMSTDYTEAVLYIVSAFTFLLNIFVSIRYNIFMCLIITFIPAFSGFTFTLMPNPVWLVLYIGFLTGLFLKVNMNTDLSGKMNGDFHRRGNEYILKDDTGYSKDMFVATVCVGIAVAVISFATMMIMPSESYNRPKILEDVRMSFENGIVFIQNNVWGSRSATGGINGGKLGDIANIKFSDNTDLECELPLTGQNIYLKAYIGSEYTGRSFEPLSEEVYEQYADEFATLKKDNFNSLTMTSDILKKLEGQNVFYTDAGDAVNSYEAEIKIKNGVKKYSYLPYYTDTIADANINVEDGYMKKISSGYTLPIYWTNKDAKYDVISDYGTYKRYADDYEFFGDDSMRSVTSEGLERYFADEKIYREIVKDVYTRLPNSVNSEIIENMERYNITTNDDIFSLITNLQEYYRDNCEYTLSPGKVPEDEDVVEYFLYKTRKGYCTYFAASSVILLRAAGIPARYVEGYVVRADDYTDRTKSEDGKVQTGKVEVKDSAAHAWTEVYINGYGWIPVDFTPGYQDKFRASGVVHTDEEKETMTSEAETETVEKETKSREEVETESHENVTEEETTAAVTNTNNYNGKKEYLIVTAMKKLACIIAVIIAIIVVVWIYHLIVILILKVRLDRADRSKKVKIIYKRMEKLLALVNIKRGKAETYTDFAKRADELVNVFDAGIFTECMRIIESMEYGNHHVTAKECQYLESALKTAQKRVASYMGRFRRIIYRFFVNRLGI